MYMGHNATKALHEQRVRELLEDTCSERSSLLVRLSARIAVVLRAARPKTVYSAPESKSLEQTS